jgi:integrase
MQRISCKRGLDVWQFRWPETTHDGRRLHRKKVVGSVTGLQQSELFGLKWGDIDFGRGTMSVTRSIVYGVVLAKARAYSITRRWQPETQHISKFFRFR